MARTHRNLFPEIVSFQNLLLAARKAERGKRYRESTLRFNFRLEEELLRLQEELLSGTYRPGAYHHFVVQDSKPRLISAAPYRDRVVHHAVMNVIEPIFDRSFIHQSYACRRGRGTHAALKRFRAHLARHAYVLKCDIRRYFDNIVHEILLSFLERRIRDGKVMELLELILESWTPPAEGKKNSEPTEKEPVGDGRKRGIPIGNLTSQFFANLYLDRFDHWVTESLRVGPYLRYTDDFCVFGSEKGRLAEARSAIVERLADLGLSLNEGKSRLYARREGIEFLGFRHLPGQVRVRKENTGRFRVRLRRLERDLAAGRVSLERVRASVTSWRAHAAYADSEALCRKLIPPYLLATGGGA